MTILKIYDTLSQAQRAFEADRRRNYIIGQYYYCHSFEVWQAKYGDNVFNYTYKSALINCREQFDEVIDCTKSGLSDLELSTLRKGKKNE